MATPLDFAVAELRANIREPEAWEKYDAETAEGTGLNWCAALVVYCHRRAGFDIENPDQPRWTRFHHHAVWRMQRTWDRLGLRAEGPVEGGIFVTTRGRTNLVEYEGGFQLAPRSPGHVGFVWKTFDHEWLSIEGNMGPGDGNDGIIARTWTRPEQSVVAFYRPMTRADLTQALDTIS